MSYIVTGGCGFIGSNFVNFLNEFVADEIVVIDSLTYAANLDHLADSDKIRHIKVDIANNSNNINQIFEHNNIEAVFHFAAESHVDNSITGPSKFVETNIVGTFNLLEATRRHGNGCRFVHVSTDEVYGALTEDGSSFLETKLLEPNNVYSASKASSDLLVRSYNRTFGLDVVTTRCCNNYGPHQDTEKLLPKVISNALNDVSIPVYGKGDNVREWIYVKDHCRAIWEVYTLGNTNEVYNIGSGIEISNLKLVQNVLTSLDMPFNLIKFVADRPGHDFRYSIDNSKFMSMVSEFEFTDFDEGLKTTIDWYRS